MAGRKKQKNNQAAIEARNKKTVISVLGLVVGMVVLAYASVPLYGLFCRVTGFGGTTRTAESGSGIVLDQKMTIRFNADTARDMPWRFKPEVGEMELNIGADGFANFIAENLSGKPITGTALYNVTPLKAGKYFTKIQCFCFEEQLLLPGQKMNFPVTFFIDPKIAGDPNLKDVKTITLSYTFFQKDSENLEKALQTY